MREGFVFERRYRDRPCADPDHLRNAIVYTHLNPVRAGLCSTPDEYAWSSHRAWVGDVAVTGTRQIELTDSLQLFATGPRRTTAELRADYVAFMEWRCAFDHWLLLEAEGKAPGCSPPSPPVGQGDAHWKLYLCARPPGFDAHGVSGEPVTGDVDPLRPDLSAIAGQVLEESEPGLDARVLRSRWGGPVYVRARHLVIRRASALGYRNAQIAAYLRLSATAVSDVVTADRKRRLLCRT
jgi:hypothetical protein